MCVCTLNCLVMCDSFVTPWTVAHQAPLSSEFRQEYWSGLPFPSPGDFPERGIETVSPVGLPKYCTNIIPVEAENYAKRCPFQRQESCSSMWWAGLPHSPHSASCTLSDGSLIPSPGQGFPLPCPKAFQITTS